MSITSAKMVDPDRGVREYQLSFAGRLLRAMRRPGSAPASAASLRADSLAMSASRPARMSVVFSLIPVRCLAFSTSSSSRFKVVLICIMMHE